MKQIQTQVEDLGQLAELDANKRRLDAGTVEFKKITLESAHVRERLSAATLHHYDLRISKGKRGAAKIRNKVCGGCYLSLPSGQLADMLNDAMTLQICGNCSIFILPADPLPAVEVSAEALAKPAPRKRKAKVKETELPTATA